MSKLTLGVIGTSKKEDERRVPIHPAHLPRVPEDIRRQLIFEEGYGAPFGIADSKIAAQTGGIATRHELLADIGSVIITKPVLADLQELREGGTLWGYVHCVQQRDITQAALDRKLTLIAFEEMFVWTPNGQIGRHTFYKNNEMAGYCAVIHALQVKGIDGHYGNQRKTILFGFGAVSRGAIYALKAHGFKDITICIQRPDHEVREEVLDCHYVRIRAGNEGEARMLVVEHDGTVRPLTDLISEADIIINGTFQETENPTHFVTEAESSYLKPNSLIIDVSCDEGMGFFFCTIHMKVERPFMAHSTSSISLPERPLYTESRRSVMPASAARRRCVGWRLLLVINLIRDSISNRIDVGVGIVRLTLLKRKNRGILNHSTINIYSLSNGLILLPTITARHHSR